MRDPNQNQIAGFWVWYQSRDEKGKRSFALAAERCGVPEIAIENWHREFKWAALAAEQDEKFSHKFEKEIEKASIGTFKEAQKWQHRIIARLYAKYESMIDKMPPSSLRIADLVKLMEFHIQYGYTDEQGARSHQGNLLTLVLQTMPPEERTKFNAAIERAQDAGLIRFGGVESAGRN